MIRKSNKNQNRLKKHARIRATLSGTAKKPRLNVYRSTMQIYAQLIDDEKAVTLVSSSSVEKGLASKMEGKTKNEKAFIVGNEIGKKAIKKGISEVVFDRGGYIYTGRVQKLAEGARSAGLTF